jgi:hypothetical protein
VRINVLGGIVVSTLIYEENWNEGTEIGWFLLFWAGFHVRLVRRGDT